MHDRLKNWRKFKVRELLGFSWQNCCGSPEKGFFEIWYLTYLPAGFGIHIKCRARFSIRSRIEGCRIGFSGPGISLIWISGFGIWKQNQGEFRDWKYLQAGMWDAKITLGIRGLHEILGRDYEIEEPYQWVPRIRLLRGIRDFLWCGIQEMLFPVQWTVRTFLQ